MRVIERPRSVYLDSSDSDDFLVDYSKFFSPQEREKIIYPYVQEQKRRSQNVDSVRIGGVAKFTSDSYIRIIDTGSVAEVRIRSEGQRGGFIRKLPECTFPGDSQKLRPYVLTKDIYVDEWGEEHLPRDIHFMREHSKTRKDNIRQVKKACNNFKWLVRKNQDKVRKFITLTYAENMTNTRRLYEDYRRFIQKLYRAFPDITGYLVAFEPQQRGAWHAHILILSDVQILRTKEYKTDKLKFKSRKLISNKIIHELWGHGFTKCQDVKSVRDLGAYITSYLTNVKSGKLTKKGARLALYPSGFRFLRSSRAVDRPTTSFFIGSPDDLVYSSIGGELCMLYDYETVKKFGSRYIRSRICCIRQKPPIDSGA